MSQRIRFRRLLAVACAIAIPGAVGYWLTGRHVRSSATGTLEQAEHCLRERDNAGARKTLRWLLWFEPEHDRALLIAGVSLNADERFSEAIGVLERIPDRSEQAESAGVALAASLIPDGQLERAESVLRRHVARFPWSIGARDRLVRLYLMELRKRDATTLLSDHLQRYPHDLVVLPDLLELETGIETPHSHVAELESADRAHPGQAPVVLALASAYSLSGRLDEARRRFRAALELRPDDPQTRILAAEFHLDLGEVDAAASLLTSHSASGIVDDDRYWFLRSRIAEQSGNAEDAYDDLERALTIRPHEEAYLLTQAGLLRRLGRADEAVYTAQRAARLADDRKQLLILSDRWDRNRPDPALCLEFADLLERLGHPEQAAGWRRVSTAVEVPMDALPDPARGFQDVSGNTTS